MHPRGTAAQPSADGAAASAPAPAVQPRVPDLQNRPTQAAVWSDVRHVAAGRRAVLCRTLRIHRGSCKTSFCTWGEMRSCALRPPDFHPPRPAEAPCCGGATARIGAVPAPRWLAEFSLPSGDAAHLLMSTASRGTRCTGDWQVQQYQPVGASASCQHRLPDRLCQPQQPRQKPSVNRSSGSGRDGGTRSEVPQNRCAALKPAPPPFSALEAAP